MSDLLDYTPIINKSLSNFTGRAWLDQNLQQFLQQPAPGYFLLAGEPGIGKTAFAAHVVTKNGYLHHFVSAQDVNLHNPRLFIKSLTAQLAERYGALDQAAEVPQFTATLNVNGVVQPGARVAVVNIENLVATPLEDEFLIQVAPLLQQAVKQAREPVVLVIDALDEATVTNIRPAINQMVRWLAQVAPVHVIITSEAGPVLDELSRQLPAEQLQRLDINGMEAENLDDCRVYLQHAAAQPDLAAILQQGGVTVEMFVERLLSVSEGNFLYITALVGDVLQRSALPDLDKLPARLSGVYMLSMQTRFGANMETWNSLYAPLLGTLAVARQPLSEAQLAEFSTIPAGRARQVRLMIGNLVNEDQDTVLQKSVYRIYHHSFARFLLDPDQAGEFWLPKEEQHERIAAVLLNKNADPTQPQDTYALHNMAYHYRLAGTNFQANLYQMITPQVRQARRIQERSDYQFIQDLGEAVAAALADGLPAGLPELVRCGLVEATLHSMVSNTPPELLGELAQAGDGERARGLALSASDPQAALAKVVIGLALRSAAPEGDAHSLEAAWSYSGQLNGEGDAADASSHALAEVGWALALRQDARSQMAFDHSRVATLGITALDQAARALAHLARLEAPFNPAQAHRDFRAAIAKAHEMPAYVVPILADISNIITMVTQTVGQQDWIRRQTPYDVMGAKARALADVAAELQQAGEVHALFDDTASAQCFAEAEELAAKIPDMGMHGQFAEHTRAYIADRRTRLPEPPHPPRSLAEIEVNLQAAEQRMPDPKGFLTRALLSLARALSVAHPVLLRGLLQRAEVALSGVNPGYVASLLLEIAGLYRSIGQDQTAARLEQKGVVTAGEDPGLLLGYTKWLQQHGLEEASLREVMTTRAGLAKESFYSQQALANMTASLVTSDLASAKEMLKRLVEPMQRARALAALAGVLTENDAAPMMQEILALAVRQGIAPATPGAVGVYGTSSSTDLILSEALHVLAPVQPERAQQLAQALTSPALKAQALVELAVSPVTAPKDAAELWEQAWAVCSITKTQDTELSEVLARQGEHWAQLGDPRAEAAFINAVQAARSDPSDLRKVRALTAVASRMINWRARFAGEILEEAANGARQLAGVRECGRVLSDTAAVWMELEPSRAMAILAELRFLGYANFLDGVSQVIPSAVRRWGADLGVKLDQALQAGVLFFAPLAD